jgi:diaminopimelate decarboxylase
MDSDILAEAATRWGTPLYLTDLDAAAANLATYQRNFPGALIAYAVKANSDPQLLRRLVADGAGAEIVNEVELALAVRAGCPPECMVMNGVGKTDSDLRAALAAGALVNAESLDELDALVALGARRIGLRMNPGLDAQTHPHLATGSADAKFGIAWADLAEARRCAGAALESIGAHIGSNVASVEPFEQLAKLLATTGAERVDIGGGVASMALVPAVARAVGEHLKAELICEPGRAIVADAGWLLTRVIRRQREYLVADAGMTELIRPILYGADHPVRLVAPGAAAEGVRHLAGPVCEAGDILVRDLGRYLAPEELAVAGDGALLAIGNTGAYGAAMASNYNGRLRPAEAVLEGGELRLSRRRETPEDRLARDVPERRKGD